MAIQDQVSHQSPQYAENTPNPALASGSAGELFPSGITHDARNVDPYGVFIQRAEGPHKWDVDGNRYIDYWMGHGAMLLGHAHPAVVEAIREQVARGTHAGGSTRLEIDWARLIMDLVPCAESVKFTSSGTEATLLALRAARAYTGKSKIIKFEGHFHGWHDYAMCGVVAPYNVPMSAGIPEEVQRSVILVPFNDPAALTQALDSSNDIAAVIAEPGGSYDDTVPTNPVFLKHLREATTRRGVVLIFDEVVTGFRYAVGGAQEYFGVIPDMATLAKVMAGGLNGGAVVGRREIMEVFEPRDDPQWNRYHMVPHPGTFNANPLSAAAGIAALKLIATGEPTKRAQEMTDMLISGINQVLTRRGAQAVLWARLDLQNFYRQGGAAPGEIGFQ
jgi:glutamate-1-semialdehyde 2,1-aminomutase